MTIHSKDRPFCIFTADQGRHIVHAPSLRTALRNCGIDEAKTPIVAALDAACLPAPASDEKPFMAVLVRNPNFVA